MKDILPFIEISQITIEAYEKGTMTGRCACAAFWFGGFVVDENSYLKASKLHDNMLFVSETVVKPLYAHTGKVTLVQ